MVINMKHRKRRHQRGQGSQSSQSGQSGMTLVEMLVALGIFGAVAVASITILSITLNGRAQIEESAKRIGDLETMRSLLKEDLAQMIDRPVRSGVSGALEAGFLGAPLGQNEAGEKILLRFTRLGHSNPRAAYARSNLLRVTWMASGQGIIRETQYYPDAVAQTPRQRQIFLPGASDISVSFLGDRRWRQQFSSGQNGDWPEAIKLSLTHPYYGALAQDFLLSYRPRARGDDNGG